MGYRAEDIVVGNGRPDAIPFTGRIDVVEYLGNEQLVHINRKDMSLQAKLPVDERLTTGDEREFSVPRDKLLLFDAETEQRVRV